MLIENKNQICNTIASAKNNNKNKKIKTIHAFINH